MRITIICIIIALVAHSCKKNEVVPNVDHSSKYYPIAVGHTWIYQVDSIIFYGNLNQKSDTLQYSVRHTVVSTSTDAQGRETFTVEKSIKNSPGQIFQFDKNFGVQKTHLELAYNTADTRIPILVFPIANDKVWSGNTYTEKDEWNIISGKTNEVECSYSEIHLPKEVASTLYDSTCVVSRYKEENAINSRYTNELYAANVGMVSKYFENLENYDTDDPKGSIYTYKLISFEK